MTSTVLQGKEAAVVHFDLKCTRTYVTHLCLVNLLFFSYILDASQEVARPPLRTPSSSSSSSALVLLPFAQFPSLNPASLSPN